MRPATKRQIEVLNIIKSYVDEFGMPPTRKEVGAAMGIKHLKAVDDHFRALEKKGLIKIYVGTARGVKVL